MGMAHHTILIIRHAEKPDKEGDEGVDASGRLDPESLTPQGWQRAGIWSELFSPSVASQSSLPTPGAIYASAPSSKRDKQKDAGVGSKSRRPVETLEPLAAKLKSKGLKEINQGFQRGQETALAEELVRLGGTVLVCWQHEDILTIANALRPAPKGLPAKWPKERFNVIFKFDRADGQSEWTFQQLTPVMLAGDSEKPI
jgi:hypothetical protein